MPETHSHQPYDDAAQERFNRTICAHCYETITWNPRIGAWNTVEDASTICLSA